MFLIMSRIHNLCSNHIISITAVEKSKSTNRPMGIENLTVDPGDCADICAFDGDFSLIHEYLNDIIYHCDFIPISADQRENKSIKRITITDHDTIACKRFDFVDDNDDLKAIKIEGSSLPRICTIWEMREIGLKLKTYGERITDFMKNLFHKDPNINVDERKDGHLRKPLIDAVLLQ